MFKSFLDVTSRNLQKIVDLPISYRLINRHYRITDSEFYSINIDMLAVFGWDDRDTVRIYPEVGSLNNTNRQLEAGFSGQISITNDIVLRSGDPTLYKRRKEAFIEDFLQLIKASLSENSKPLIFSGESFVLLFSDDQSSQEKSIMYCEFGRFHLKNGSYLPQPLHFPQKISSIACGSSHALVLTEDGSVFSIGRGRFGELGLGENTLSTEGQLRKLDLPFSERVFYIAAGSNHSAVISEPYGYLYTFGCGSHYRLGHDTDDHIYTPRRVEALVGVGDFNASAIPMGIKLVGCGTWHTIAVAKGSNDVFGMGWNKFGQLGTLLDQTGKHAEQIINYPERISQLDDDHLLGDDNHNVVAVTCGSKLSCLLTSSQRLIVM